MRDVRPKGSQIVDVTPEVAWGIVGTRIGPLLLAATDQGLVRVAFADEDHEAVLAVLAARVGPTRHDPARVAQAAGEIEEYLAGARRAFDTPIDRRLATGFRRAVQEHLTTIPYGATRTYGQVAAEVGNAGAVRAVGSACATNPLPVVVPCHRVVRADGTIGRYGGGSVVKAALLSLESRA